MPVVLLFLLLHTNYPCGIIYVRVRRTNGPTESAKSRLRVLCGLQKWGGGGGAGLPHAKFWGDEHPLPPPYFSTPGNEGLATY